MYNYKVDLVLGTRPELIKLAPVFQSLNSFLPNIRIVSTGQHKEMLDQTFEVFGIRPSIDLDLMRKNKSLEEILISAINKLHKQWSKSKPDLVVVHGDTISTLAGAMASFYKKIPIAHIEAGLRSGNIWEPFPEESHRKMVAAMTSIHFPPTV